MLEEKRQQITTIIFDMDGTLIDSEPVYMRDLVRFLNMHEIHLEKEERYSVIGRDMSFFWGQMEKWMPETYTMEEIQTAFNELPRDADYPDLIFPHVRRMLKELKKNNYTLALASASPIDNIQKVLKQCEIGEYFSYVVSGTQVANNKPEPDIYFNVMENLGCTADEVLIVEDSTNGLKAAIASGAYVVAKEDLRYDFEQDRADVIISDFLELLNLLHV